MDTLLLALYWLAAAGLCIYGLNCHVLCATFRRGRAAGEARLARQRVAWAAATPESALPMVTVQLPIYNERYVVERLLRSVVAFDWPADRLQVQVLDDSTDDTTRLTASLCAELAAAGHDIQHVRRRHREGFKAGALRDAMPAARGNLIAIFDADFVPQPDFLRRMVPLLTDPGVGLAQARWGHLNRHSSALTRAQALAIDGHFGIEQAGRCWAGWMLNFNGTAGIWRRQAIEDAGGWQADTLTEDLDLSYRAQLCGWKVEYAVDVEVPAEIPADISAFRSQQRRWAKGSIQTAMKLLPRVMRSELPLVTRCQAALHLTHYLVHPLMIALVVLAVPVLLSAEPNQLPPLAIAGLATLLALGTTGPTALYVSSQRALREADRRRLRDLPLLMLLGTGIAVSNTRAVLEALLRIDSEFVRTPKASLTDGQRARADVGYRIPIDALCLVEAALALWSAVGVAVYVQRGSWLIGPFLALNAASFAWVAALSLRERSSQRRRAAAASSPHGATHGVPHTVPHSVQVSMPVSMPAADSTAAEAVLQGAAE
jgi:cellulose synthase/poly-beta-1,6-N-acetylglucosamine synthase-like glycosyltransferase